MAQDVLFIDQTLREAASLGPAAVRAILKEMKHLQISLLDVPMALNKSLPLRTQPEFFRAVLPLEQGAATEAAQQGFRQVLFSCSLQQGLPAHTVEVLHEAKMQKLRATLLVEDASLASDLLWQAVLPMLCAAGLEGLAFKDSSAILQPLRLQEHLDLLQQQWPQLTLEFHASNQKQLATANVWAAWQAGVRRLAVSIGGMNNSAPWEEVLLLLRQMGELELPVPANMAQRSRWLLQLLGEEVAPNKAVIGENIFAHESGLHVAGVAKDASLYEAFPPELVGLERKIVLGKHSGTTSLRVKFKELGLPFPSRAEALLIKIRALAVARKRAISDEELLSLWREETA